MAPLNRKRTRLSIGEKLEALRMRGEVDRCRERSRNSRSNRSRLGGRNRKERGAYGTDDNDSDVEFIRAELPTLHKLYEAAHPLEQLLLSCGLQSAGNYVKRAVDVARSEIMKESGGPKTQMPITAVSRFRLALRLEDRGSVKL